MDKYEILQTCFGYDSFRPGQERLIDALTGGRDVLGILPTGGGKSLCYQVPALLLPGTAVVISPLISLMSDQVRALLARGIRAAYVHAGQSPGERADVFRRARDGKLKLLYLSPERLLSADFRRFAESAPVSFFCVDEAHCVSMWGRDFRPAYRKIAPLLDVLYPKGRPPVAAFTASAAPGVRREIAACLALKDPFLLTTGFDRPNLYFELRRPSDKKAELLSLLKHYRGQCGIIYCLTRRSVDLLFRCFRKTGISAVRYHAGLSQEERRSAETAWQKGEVPLMVATNAFGMGIDKGDVRFVIHYNMPTNPENYYQEAGRAGRDGQPADCILFADDKDLRINRHFIAHARDPQLKALLTEELNCMRIYCGGNSCLRAFMLRHFGEEAPDHCGRCSVCLQKMSKNAVPFGTVDEGLYKSLAALRLSLSESSGIPPSGIFTNRMLRDMAAARPETMRDLLALEGIRWRSALRFGRLFLREIRVWRKSH